MPKVTENKYSEEELKEAIQLFNQGRYIEAIEVFSYYSNNGDFLSRQYLARCYHRLQKYEVAYKHYQFLAKYGEEEFKDYGISMVAVLESMWGNYSKAIKILRALPPNPRNQISISILFWKKYKEQKDELSIREAIKILNKLDADTLGDHLLKTVYHLKALVFQSQKEYRLAEDFYKKALEIAYDDIVRGQVLNDYASLYIDLKNYDEAEKILIEAKRYVDGKSEIEGAFNNKWLGILAIKRRDYSIAREHLITAVKVIREKELLREVAGIVFLLADPDFPDEPTAKITLMQEKK